MPMRKAAVVTGAGSGIGKASALALMRNGFSVVLSGRRKEPLEAGAVEGRAFGSEAIAVAGDVTDPAFVKALFGEAKAAFGRVDVLFNNAGVFSPAVPLEEVTAGQWNAAVAVNLTAAFLCTQEAFRSMKTQGPRGGRIINNGSISAHAPRPFSAPYTVTMHAITGLTKSTSLDGRAYDIACGQIDIGNAATDMTGPMASGVRQADGSIKPEPRIDVQVVADAVVFMAALPLNANVQFMTVMATKMPYIGRG